MASREALGVQGIQRGTPRCRDSLTPHERQAILDSFRTSIWGNPYDHRTSLARRKSALAEKLHDPLAKRISQARASGAACSRTPKCNSNVVPESSTGVAVQGTGGHHARV
jgi:hypothetical protein